MSYLDQLNPSHWVIGSVHTINCPPQCELGTILPRQHQNQKSSEWDGCNQYILHCIRWWKMLNWKGCIMELKCNATFVLAMIKSKASKNILMHFL